MRGQQALAQVSGGSGNACAIFLRICVGVLRDVTVRDLLPTAMLKSPLVARKSPRSLAGVEVSSGAVTSLVVGVAHAERITGGDHEAGVVQ